MLSLLLASVFLLVFVLVSGLERAREGLIIALALVPDGAQPPGPDPLDGASELVVLADVYELIDNPQLLTAYAREMRDVPDVTLAIDASDIELARLEALVAQAEVPDSVDVLAIPGPLDRFARARLSCGVRARLSERDEQRHLAPRFGAAEVEALRVVATAAR